MGTVVSIAVQMRSCYNKQREQQNGANIELIHNISTPNSLYDGKVETTIKENRLGKGALLSVQVQRMMATPGGGGEN